ncbi:MAG: thioredoxin domain-containing protein [Candidatus Helarchaeota archaeon]|nr:thioredoxin domain-containing protein [Candidatus Helarchaeota archaeon]
MEVLGLNNDSKVNNDRVPNKLISEKSPYLLQHAYNPVQWYPWGDEAFEKARKENKPIFLSIGYSTCHWCHVMEKESFEDQDVAKLMNEVFVSIKVDREERPDIDKVYMTICQAITGSGGWPLTIIMTPDKKPFFAGTYIPKRGRFGRIGMLELIPRIENFWINKREELKKSADKISVAVQDVSNKMKGEKLGKNTLNIAYKELESRFDEKEGGFSGAPKFPTPHNILFLLRYWKRSSNKKALWMVEKTLQSMRLGGIFDHIGFGFHRYSTDFFWLVPHFEKMLYDQALLLMAYTEAFQVTKKKEYEKTAREILTYVLRDMTSPEGGFYSAEDADSKDEEGNMVEGKYYLWRMKEIEKKLESVEKDMIINIFNIKKGGNFLEQATGEKTGENILHLKKSISDLATDLNISKDELEMCLEKIRLKLFNIRENRSHPHKDDKILTDWNGLMIAALAKAARILDEPEYVKKAEKAIKFIENKMIRSDGRLLHRYRDGQTAILANLDDYAYLIWGCLELYETTFNLKYIKLALDFNKDLLEHFLDSVGGGFYFTPDDGEELLLRQKEIYDGALPSGNSVAMLNLLRLGRITGNSDYEDKAAKIGIAFSRKIMEMPSAYTQLMVALDFAIGPSYEVVIAGNSKGDDTEAMIKAIRNHFIPNKVIILNPTEQKTPEIFQFVEFIKSQSSIEGKATAYVCSNYLCKTPTIKIDKMLELLEVTK